MSRSGKQYNKGHKILCGLLCLLAVLLFNFPGNITTLAQKKVFTPQIPKANRHVKNKVFLEHADILSMDENISPNYQVLTGNVKFRKQGMYMYCDSAHFYDKTNSLDAFGNVRMEQGDTLFVFADVMYYDGQNELARLRYNVKMKNRAVTLFTDSLNYSIPQNLGYYFEGGRIINKEDTLSSVYGQYEPDTKDAEFLFDVELVNKKMVLNTDTLKYNTKSRITNIVGKTTIVSDSTVIYADKGWYNTGNETATLYDRALIVGKNNQKLTGDTLFYDKQKNFGEAFGNMVLTDSVHNTILEGNYGYHDDNKKISFATKHARALEYSQGDTLYLHGDTIRTYLDTDSMRVLSSYRKVRFFRKDVQGLADSISFTSSDSILHMHRHPIIWNENKQIFGNIVNVHMQDSTVDWAKLPNYGFIAEYLGETYYNQLAGKEMYAIFKDGDIRQLDVSGNVQAIFYPQEKDSTYNKLITSESSFLKILFHKKDIEKLTMWPEVTGHAIPLYLAKKSELYLPDFGWYQNLRPINKDDIFNISPEMIQLLDKPEKESARSHKPVKHVDGVKEPENKETENVSAKIEK